MRLDCGGRVWKFKVLEGCGLLANFLVGEFDDGPKVWWQLILWWLILLHMAQRLLMLLQSRLPKLRTVRWGLVSICLLIRHPRTIALSVTIPTNAILQSLQSGIHNDQLRRRVQLELFHHIVHSLGQKNSARHECLVGLNAGIAHHPHFGIYPRVDGANADQGHFGRVDSEGGSHVNSKDEGVLISGLEYCVVGGIVDLSRGWFERWVCQVGHDVLLTGIAV